jgi:hypothetical protein
MGDLKFTTAGEYMKDDRCCGSGTCIINDQGECWCGQQWDGEKMCATKLEEMGNDTKSKN